MLDETEDAIEKAAIQTATREIPEIETDETRTRARFIYMEFTEGDFQDAPGRPSTGNIGRYLDRTREFRGYVVEKEREFFGSYHWWHLVEEDDVDEELGEIHRVECKDCEWLYESPYLGRLEERARDHDGVADGHRVDEIVAAE